MRRHNIWHGSGPPLSLEKPGSGRSPNSKRARQLDPLSLIINADLGVGLYTARRYDEAIAQLRKTIEMDPRFYFAHLESGRSAGTQKASSSRRAVGI